MGSLSNEILDEIVAASSQGLLVLDASESEIRVVHANPCYARLSGFSATELEDSVWFDFVAADDDSPELIQLKRKLLCDEPVELTLPLLRKDGDIWLARLRLSPLSSGGPDRRLLLAQQLSDDGHQGESAELLKRALGRARRKLASLDRLDQVTGLMSRAQFELLLRRELAVSRREKRSLSLMLFSVPELDIYRQTFGDNAADSCLRMVGAQIAGTFRRASDLCARFDASTIAVAVHGQEQEQAEQLVGLVETKARSLGLHNPRGHTQRYIFVRGAVVAAKADNDDVDALLARAVESLDSGDGARQAAGA